MKNKHDRENNDHSEVELGTELHETKAARGHAAAWQKNRESDNDYSEVELGIGSRESKAAHGRAAVWPENPKA